MENSEPLILAFDTSAAHCAAALLSGDRVLAQAQEPMAKGQAERLMPLLAEVLAAGAVSLADLDAIGVGVGPGNFTGIRISVAAARGLALGLGVPAVGVGTLEALAHGLPRPICAIADARRGAVYVQCFGGTDADAPMLLDVSELPHGLTANFATGLATGPGADLAVAQLPGLTVLPPAQPLAVAIARIAATRWTAPGLPRPAPLYLRAADAAPAREAGVVMLAP